MAGLNKKPRPSRGNSESGRENRDLRGPRQPRGGRETLNDLNGLADQPRRAAETSASSVAAQVTKSSGRRIQLRPVQARAAASVTVSARSKASALGMKSTADHRRIAA